MIRTLHSHRSLLKRTIYKARFLSSTTSGNAPPPSWRKNQLSKLERKFLSKEENVLDINDDEDVQPMWRSMESRVTKRRSMTKEEATVSGKTGRRNIKKTEEEYWLEEGVYDKNDADNDADNSKK